MKDVMALIRELAEFEKAPEAVDIDIAQLEKDGFGAEAVFKVLLAKVENRVVGMALYYPAYSTWKGRMVYLEDLYVKASHRNNGIATQLMNALISKSKKWGAKRVKWQVLDWNETAIQFYKKFNVQFDSEWVNCDLYEEEIQKY
ncbi:MAG: GNAT family N-acetyltransferase [Chitinophagales bacterium]